MTGVPFGTQTAWLSSSTSGWPPDVTRVAPIIHCAVTHGVGEPPVTIGQPGHDVRRGDRRRRHTADHHARVGGRRLRLTTVGTQDDGSDVNHESGHRRHTTTRAPLLTVTVGPVITMLAPLPFWM